ncbi:glutathione S-transferase family protein [Sphingomonas sp. OK281]|uniref:glutathione S-transferase family protein n=1 Tax=Sphingomonas sp. OK281 TaxID=1881067 RepID=UPI0008EDF8C9|nr:glutathione S-transferase family protein [Sphingomonas sp. OK281]SFO43380.1 glutathione S-transferase [Sphingomonas sp. OK281]
MKLYWGPHTCAIGIHILLEEIGAPYETEQLDVAGGATHRPPFSGLNPKGKVPTLVRDDGTVLTEFAAIATWLARMNPAKALLPTDHDLEARAVETIAYIEGTIHGQGYARIFNPKAFEPQDVVHQTIGLGSGSVSAQGRKMVEEGFAILDPQLGHHAFAVADTFTIADAALFYAERWAPQHDIILPVNIQRHYEMMLDRPAIRKVRQLWGEA